MPFKSTNPDCDIDLKNRSDSGLQDLSYITSFDLKCIMFSLHFVLPVICKVDYW